MTKMSEGTCLSDWSSEYILANDSIIIRENYQQADGAAFNRRTTSSRRSLNKASGLVGVVGRWVGLGGWMDCRQQASLTSKS